MTEAYDYKKPRKINVVSLLIVAVVVGGGYFGWFFGPVYLQRYHVDRVLTDIGYRAIDLPALTGDPAIELEAKLLGEARQQIKDLGVATENETDLEVYFDPAYKNVVADYQVVITPPVGGAKLFHFLRRAEIPAK